MTNETWLICGGRNFGMDSKLHTPEQANHKKAERSLLMRVLDNLIEECGAPAAVIHGDAKGADRLAGAYMKTKGSIIIPVPADWRQHGLGAGSIRNQKMLDKYDIDLVIAFPGGRGTLDMVTRSKRKGIPVVEIKE